MLPLHVHSFAEAKLFGLYCRLCMQETLLTKEKYADYN